MDPDYFSACEAREWCRSLVHSPAFWTPSVALARRLPTWWCREHGDLKQWENIPRSRRIGFGFEQLIYRFVELSPRLELVRSNWVLSEEHRTLGELDLLVQTPQGLEHWELALKFYLFDPASRHFIGSNGRDRLHLKLKKIREHQLPLGQHPQVRAWCEEQGWGMPSSRPLVLGRLFYPWLGEGPWTSELDQELEHGNLNRGIWLRSSQWADFFRTAQRRGWALFPLERYHWMLTKLTALPRDELGSACPAGSFQGIAGYTESSDGVREVLRFCVVENDWPALRL